MHFIHSIIIVLLPYVINNDFVDCEIAQLLHLQNFSVRSDTLIQNYHEWNLIYETGHFNPNLSKKKCLREWHQSLFMFHIEFSHLSQNKVVQLIERNFTIVFFCICIWFCIFFFGVKKTCLNYLSNTIKLIKNSNLISKTTFIRKRATDNFCFSIKKNDIEWNMCGGRDENVTFVWSNLPNKLFEIIQNMHSYIWVTTHKLKKWRETQSSFVFWRFLFLTLQKQRGYFTICEQNWDIENGTFKIQHIRRITQKWNNRTS